MIVSTYTHGYKQLYIHQTNMITGLNNSHLLIVIRMNRHPNDVSLLIDWLFVPLPLIDVTHFA